MVKKPEKSIYEFYIDLQRKHSAEFPNEKVAVILQVWDFYEFYGINTRERQESIRWNMWVISIHKSVKEHIYMNLLDLISDQKINSFNYY